MFYYSVELPVRVTVFIITFIPAGPDQESQVAAALVSVRSPYD